MDTRRIIDGRGDYYAYSTFMGGYYLKNRTKLKKDKESKVTMGMEYSCFRGRAVLFR